jgi:hypothetical protein
MVNYNCITTGTSMQVTLSLLPEEFEGFTVGITDGGIY